MDTQAHCSSNRRRIVSLARATLSIVVVALPASGSAAQPGDWTTRPSPRVSGVLPQADARRLSTSFALAVDRLDGRADCARLFADLEADGRRLLSLTLYRAPARESEAKRCRAGRAAFTVVGSPLTCVCPSFGRLSRHDGAMILIHEALHFAGLPESPATPAALDSRGINRLVKERCGL